MKTALALAGLLVATSAAGAEELETTHLFGFTLGTDVNAVGEKEAESETTWRFGKRSGSYAALAQAFAVKFIPFQDFSIEPGVGVAHHAISSVPGLDDQQHWAFDTMALEMRYRLLNREHAPFGLTVGADPHWGRVDDVSGEPVNRFGTDFLVILDKELVAERIFGAVNILYQPEVSRLRGADTWERHSSLGVSAALNAQLQPLLLIGVEARYLRAFNGIGLSNFSGHGFFVGPTLYWKFSTCCWMAAAWSTQVAGRSVREAGSLDLVDFERNQAKLRFGYNF